MEKLIALGFIVSALLVAIASMKKVDLAKKVGLFFMVLLTFLAYTEFAILDGDQHQDLFISTAAILSIVYFFSFVRKIPPILGWILPILFVGLFILPISPVKIGEFVINFNDSRLWMFIALGYILAPISELSSTVLVRFFGASELQIQRSISPLLFGIAVFVSSFFFSSVGIFLIAIGSAIWVFSNNGRSNFLLPIFGVLGAQIFATMGQVENVNLLFGKNLEALFFGGALVLLSNVLISSSKRVVLAKFLIVFLGIALPTALLLLGTQKNDFGGVDAYVVFLIGMSVTFFAVRETAWNSVLFAIVMVVGILFVPSLYPAPKVEIINDNSMVATTDAPVEKADPFDLATSKSLDVLKGQYTIDASTFSLNFELGPAGGRTKGKFKEIDGKFVLDGENSVVEISLPSKSLTTLNMYRDESLHGKEYFNVAKYTVMNFASSKLVKVVDGYELQGVFKMLGKENQQLVRLKYVRDSEKGNPVLLGAGKIDRTQFGMTPDPKEGNVVDFSFEIELLKK